ncbi:MAG: flagellar hook-length control protein FliK [Nitrospiraceae bacterium]|nr:MAG: flagellar hook-length control protein FliK [Nitrospiraceae bacterium]
MRIAFHKGMEMMPSSMPEINTAQPVNNTSVAAPEGGAQSGGSGFSLVINQELNNNGNNSAAENPETGAGLTDQSGNGLTIAGDLLSGMVSAALTNMSGQQTVLINECESGKTTGALLEGPENGLKTGALLHEIFTALQGADKNVSPDLQADLSEGSGTSEGTTPEGTLGASENLVKPGPSSENGLKAGALLYEILTAYQGADENGPRPDLPVTTGKDNLPQPGTPSEHGLKLGIMLSASDAGRPVKGNSNDSNNLLAALGQNINDNPEDNTEASQVDLVKAARGLLVDKNAHREQTTHDDGDIANENTKETAGLIKNPQDLLIPGKTKEINNMDAARNFQNTSPRGANAETISDSSGPVNSGIATGNSRGGEGIVSGSAARPAGFTQVLDNIVYVIKGNSRLGVSVDHGTLGKLDINVSMEKGMLNVHINTTEKMTREFIENNMQHIVDSLSKEGMHVGGMSVALKERKGQEEGVFTAAKDDNNEKEIIYAEGKTRAASGLVSVFA